MTAGTGPDPLAARSSCCRRPGGCSCDPLAPPAPTVVNPPAQPALRWQVSPHGHSLARLRAGLADPAQPLAVRTLAHGGGDDPLIALLDAWAVVADTVTFYTERIAQEGFLRTATELQSVRRLGEEIGYELRPGVAAEAEIAFDVETAPGAPASVVVPLGTPVQSVPGPGQLPQTFETNADLTAYGRWNAVPVAPSRRQELGFGTTEVWLRGMALGVVPGDGILVVGAERRRFGRTPAHRRGPGLARGDDERWDFRLVRTVEEPVEAPGWTLLHLEERVGFRAGEPLTAEEDVAVHLLRRRANLFGYSAPDPTLLVRPEGADELPVTDGDWTGIDDPRAEGTSDVVELDTDLADVLAGSWLLLERHDHRELYGIEDVAPAGLARFGVSGKATRVRVDADEGLTRFGRRETLARLESRVLNAADEPVLETVTGSSLLIEATDPAIPVGRDVLVTGFPPGRAPGDPLVAAATPPPSTEAVRVLSVSPTADDRVVHVDVHPPLALTYDPQTVRVRANVVVADHGATVHQVLGGGDATTAFQQLATRRGPLTHVRADTTGGGRSTLEVRVDGVRWDEVESLDTAAPVDRVYAARLDDDGIATITTGDGVHGARMPSGVENVEATYRVGLGPEGAMAAGQLSLLPRRPLGIATAVNPAPSRDWAAPEDLETARSLAPQRIRTLDRAVSVADHEDFAAGHAGVSLARADAVWNGRERVVLVSVLGTGGGSPGAGLVSGLTAALDAARDAGSPFVVRAGEVVGFAVRVALRHDPAYVRADVERAVIADLSARYAPAARPFGAAVVAARLLVEIRSVPGVAACTMPALVPVLPANAAEQVLLAALPGRFLPASGALVGAQALALTGGVRVEAMP